MFIYWVYLNEKQIFHPKTNEISWLSTGYAEKNSVTITTEFLISLVRLDCMTDKYIYILTEGLSDQRSYINFGTVPMYIYNLTWLSMIDLSVEINFHFNSLELL